jgi:hypothetical protein
LEELVGIPTAGRLQDIIQTACARNKSLNQVKLLLAPERQQQQQQQQHYSTATMLKTCHYAIAKFAMTGPLGSNSGASAIFRLFQARPALLEKRLKRPAATIANSRQQGSF